jgi:hypothetical protein
MVQESIEKKIVVIRGKSVMLDADLAALYDVSTKSLNQQVRRNLDRFPKDFMFQLELKELTFLRSQFVTSKRRRGGRRYLPYVFTEQGIAMLSSVLGSRRAIKVNIEIMRTFVRLRKMISYHKELAGRLDKLEKRYDVKFRIVFIAIRKLMESRPIPLRRRIGFHTK